MHQDKKKIHEKLWKSRFRVETITVLRFFRAAYLRQGPRTTFADQGPWKTVAFFWIPSKIIMSGTWNFRIIERNIKAIFRVYFSSLREDSGKIFKLMTSRRGPRTMHILYSFGFLLCEMCIRELPDPNQREKQVALVTNHVFRSLIRQCLQSDSEKRPNVEHTIVEYFKPNLSVESYAPATKKRCNLRTSENGERHQMGKGRISLVERIFFRHASYHRKKRVTTLSDLSREPKTFQFWIMDAEDLSACVQYRIIL